jgi:hypothetical protein
MSPRTLIPLLTVLLAVGVVFAVSAFREKAPPKNEPSDVAAPKVVGDPSATTPQPQAVVEAPKPAPPAPATAKITERGAPEPTRSPRESHKMVRFPDGTWLPALNGAIGAPAVVWPKDVPFAPVVKIVRDAQGLDWWSHADGSWSTSIMSETTRRGVKQIEPITRHYLPVPVAPTDPTVETPPEQSTEKPIGATGSSRRGVDRGARDRRRCLVLAAATRSAA